LCSLLLIVKVSQADGLQLIVRQLLTSKPDFASWQIIFSNTMKVFNAKNTVGRIPINIIFFGILHKRRMHLLATLSYQEIELSIFQEVHHLFLKGSLYIPRSLVKVVRQDAIKHLAA